MGEQSGEDVVDTAGEQAPSPQQPSDGVVDITDAAMMRQALLDRLTSTRPDGELVIDVRDEVLDALVDLAPTGRTLQPSPSVSGRPPHLRPEHRLEVITGGDRWMDAEVFVYDYYRQLGYTKESSRHQVEELVRWAEQSRFHAVVGPDGEIIGTARVIFGSYDTLPIGQFQRLDYSDEEPMCEISSLVLDPSVRSSGVIEHLYRAGWHDALTSGARTLTALVERWMLEAFRHTYSLPFVPCGIPEHYMGGDVIPMTMALRGTVMAETARCNPQFWLWAVECLTEEQIVDLGYTDTIELSTKLVGLNV